MSNSDKSLTDRIEPYFEGVTKAHKEEVLAQIAALETRLADAEQRARDAENDLRIVADKFKTRIPIADIIAPAELADKLIAELDRSRHDNRQLRAEVERLKDWKDPAERPATVESCYGIVKLGGYSEGLWWFEGNAPICWRYDLPFGPTDDNARNPDGTPYKGWSDGRPAAPPQQGEG